MILMWNLLNIHIRTFKTSSVLVKYCFIANIHKINSIYTNDIKFRLNIIIKLQKCLNILFCD